MLKNSDDGCSNLNVLKTIELHTSVWNGYMDCVVYDLYFNKAVIQREKGVGGLLPVDKTYPPGFCRGRVKFSEPCFCIHTFIFPLIFDKKTCSSISKQCPQPEIWILFFPSVTWAHDLRKDVFRPPTSPSVRLLVWLPVWGSSFLTWASPSWHLLATWPVFWLMHTAQVSARAVPEPGLDIPHPSGCSSH
jgi:hypothetical protein